MGNAGGDLLEVRDLMEVWSEICMPEYLHYIYNITVIYLSM